MLTHRTTLPNGTIIEFFDSTDDGEVFDFLGLPVFPNSAWGNTAQKQPKRSKAKKARKNAKLARRKNR
ncbi:hypothetical protein [Mannheimia varigena]|uniref:hypothetical protein n=1 Tax=Mannheimia varigena TaxID=85404 RepID=UPI0015B5D4B3|nr:hypothetical protein [Mannheimia varigena]QLD32984.1 hypothetical protein A6B42_04030 [Mannheimia varigena]